jgi:hypothetical protein
MASIEKRVTDGGTSYRVKVRLKGFPPESATFERMTDAKAWAAKTEADMKAGRHFGASKRHTFADLANEYAPHAKDGERLAYWRGVFGPDNLRRPDPFAHRQGARQVACRGHGPDRPSNRQAAQAHRGNGESIPRRPIGLPVLRCQGASVVGAQSGRARSRSPPRTKAGYASCPTTSAPAC